MANADHNLIAQLLLNGNNIRAIARQVGSNHSTVWRRVQLLEAQGVIKRLNQGGHGRPTIYEAAGALP